MTILRVLSISILFLVLAPAVSAQALHGSVQDPTGSRISAASVRLVHQSTQQVYETVTDSNGLFNFPSLRTGAYTLQVSTPGFQTAELRDIQVTVGSLSKLTVELAVESTETLILIGSESVPLVEYSRTGENTLISSRQISQLPVNGRNFKDLISLSANVLPARSPESSAFGNSISIAGQRTYDTLLNIDGADFINPFFAEPAGGTRPPFTLSLESVQEFQVVTGGASAEYGRNTGGIINVVTKSGTNDLHGTGFLFFRHRKLTANDGFNRPPTDFSQYQFGGNLGGPLVRERAFFFVAVDAQQRSDPFVTSFGPGLEHFLPELQGRASARQDALVVLGKLDLVLNNRHNFNYRFNFSNFTLTKRGGGNVVGIGLDHFGTERPRTQSHVGQWSNRLSASAFNELRFHYLRENRQVLANNSGPEVQILREGLVFGPNLFQNVPFNINDRFQFTEILSYTAGYHAFRFGADINITGVNEIFKGGVQGGYGYATVADFPNRPLYYFQIVGASGASVEQATTFKARQREYAFFAQDNWQTRPNLTLSLGLRWEATVNPQPQRPNPLFPNTRSIPNDYNNFAPRLGLAYDPKQNGRQVLRADFGLYYGRVPGIYLFQAFNTNGVTNGALFFFGDVPVRYPQTLPTTIPSAPIGSDVFYFDPDFELTRSGVINLSYEQQLGSSLKLTTTATASRTRNVPFLQNMNLTGGSIDAQGRFIYDQTRPFPDFGRVFNLTSLGYDRYRAVSITAQQTSSRGLQWQASYTLSSTKDTVSEEQPLFSVAQSNQFDPAYDYAASARDIRHRFVLNALYELPRGLCVSGIWTAFSGRPIDEVTGTDLNRDGNSGNDRVLAPNGQVRRRNSQRSPAFYSLDVRLSKTFKLEKLSLELLLETFNLFGSDNLTSQGTTNDGFSVVRRDTPAGTASLLNATGPPRQAQVGLRLRF